MRRIILAAFIVILACVGWVLYLEHDKQEFLNSLPQVPSPAVEEPIQTEPPSGDSVQQAEFEVKITKTDVSESVVEQDERAADVSEHYDWRTEGDAEHYDRRTERDAERNNGVADHTHAAQDVDPWQEMKTRQEREARGTLITHPDEMEPDALIDAIHHQLVERFGDIPPVHTFTELKRKQAKRIPLTLDEMITYREAQLHLFPHENTRKSLEFLREIKVSGAKFEMVYE